MKISFVIFFLSVFVKVQGQCPSTVSAFILSQTNATCPSDATITIGSNANGQPSVTYQVITAPTGVSLAPQSSNVFSSLPLGNYTFKVTCGASSANVTATISTTYTQLVATTVSTNVCSNPTSGGTITVSASGGTTPYSYALLKTNNVNYNDALSNYGVSNILNPLDTGTYQVRIKDNCGNFITKTVVMQPLVPTIFLNPGNISNNQPCGSNNVGLYYTLADFNGVNLNSINIENGYVVEIYKKAVGCTRGEFINSVNKLQGAESMIAIPINQDIYLKVINSCNDTSFVCYNYPINELIYKIHWQSVSTGCMTAENPNGLINIGKDWTENARGVEVYSLENLAGTILRTPTSDSIIFKNLPFDTYVVVGQDGCGAISRDTLAPIYPGEIPTIIEWQQSLECTNQTGTFTFDATIGGYINDLANAVVTIVSGPSNVGVQGLYFAAYRDVRWVNMLPGDYVASVVTGCGTTLINFTINQNIAGLEQSLTLSATQVCNVGNIINSTLLYNSNGYVSFDLYNAANVNISNNETGIFTGVAAGLYTVKATIEVWGYCAASYTISKTIEILSAGAPPLVTKKIVSICEDGSGNPTANGKAIIRSLGFAPFKVEVKKVAESDANYVVKYTASVNDFTVDNLEAYENYRIRITDQCGNTALTDVSVGILEQLNPIIGAAPCFNSLYTLTAPDMIDATYSWKKAGIEISTSKEVIFPNYGIANNGEYICTISIGGGCIIRSVSNMLTGINCSVLPIKIVSFTGTVQNCNVALNWKLQASNTITNVAVQKSTDGINYEILKNISDNNADSFIDTKLFAKENMYRLVITELDGSKTYSKVLSLKNNCELEKNNLIVTPNPLFSYSDMSIKINAIVAGKTELRIINSNGQLIETKNFISKKGQNVFTYAASSLNKGINFIVILFANGEIISQKIVLQ